MRITDLTITKYKSIAQTFHLKEPGTLHMFIGPNNAGKTNILDAISQLYQVNPGRLRYPDTRLSVTFDLFGSSTRTLTVEQTKNVKKFKLNGKPYDPAKGKKVLAKHIIRISALYPQESKVIKDVFESFRKQYPHRCELFLESLQIHFPKIIVTRDFFKKSVIHEGGEDRTYDRLGAGFQQIFVILLYVFHPVYSVVLLEEPEIHLHPALAKRLFSVIEQENEDTQIFMTTHSPLFIKPTNLHRVFRVSRDAVSTHVDSPRLGGHRLDYNRLKQELNAENLEMFFADEVLLVEGSSDHILMRGLIDRFYNGTKEIKVIQTFGKSNMDVYVELLQIFKIGYIVLLDHDALYDTGLELLQQHIRDGYTRTEISLIKLLKQHHIFVLPNGSIERNYPRKYQRRRKHKPANALYAANRITRSEYNSPKMRNLKEVVDAL